MNDIQMCFDLETELELAVLAETPVSARPAASGTPLALRFNHAGIVQYAQAIAQKQHHRTARQQAVLAGRRVQVRKLAADYQSLVSDLKAPVVSVPPSQTNPQLLKHLFEADGEATRYLDERNAALAEVEQMRAEMIDLHNELEIARQHSADRDDLDIELQQERVKVYQATHTGTLTAAPHDALTLAHLRAWWSVLTPAEQIEQPEPVRELVKEWHTRGSWWQGVIMRSPGVGLTPAEASPGRPSKGQGGVQRMQDQTVTVNGEARGPDWGKGAAAKDFDGLREEYNRIPKGKHVEHELRELLGKPVRGGQSKPDNAA